MEEAVVKVIESIASEILVIAKKILDSNVGVNNKIGRNTLMKSRLSQNVDVNIDYSSDSVVIDVLFANYIYYVEHGRKPRSGKQPPFSALRDWALSRNIPTDNSTLFLISRAIWRDGYEGRPLLATLEEEIEREWENTWSDKLYDEITEQLTKYFD